MRKILIFLTAAILLGASLWLILSFKAQAGVSSAQCLPSLSEATVGQEVTFSAQIEGTYSTLKWYDITNSLKSGTPPSDAVLVGSGSSLKLKFDTSGIKKIMLCPVWQQFNCYPAATCQVVIKPQSSSTVNCGDSHSRCVFVTSNTYYPDFGGPEGGDKICNDLAKASGLPGSYKAWLSGTDYVNRKAINVSDRLEHSNVPYKLVDGTIVANNWNDLTTKPLLHAININEKGQKVSTNWVWTGSMPNGQRTPATIGVVEPDCMNWSMRYSCCASCGWNDSVSNDPRGYDPVTRENILPASWGGEMSARLGCNHQYHLYCFQQGEGGNLPNGSGNATNGETPPPPPNNNSQVAQLTGECSCTITGSGVVKRQSVYYALPNQELEIKAQCTGFSKTPNYTWYIPYYSNLSGQTVKIKYSKEGSYLLKFNAISSDNKEINTATCELIIKSSHKKCQNGKCISINGADIDFCSQDSDCPSSTPTSTPTSTPANLTITVTNPQPNENIVIGSTYTVRWTVQGDTSQIRNFAMIAYSTVRQRAEGQPYGWFDGPQIRSFNWYVGKDELPGNSWIVIQAYVMRNNNPRDVDVIESKVVPIKFVIGGASSPVGGSVGDSTSTTSSGGSTSGSTGSRTGGGTSGGISGSVSLQKTALTSLIKTVYTDQYATYKVQVKNTSTQTLTYKLRVSPGENLDKALVTPTTLTLKPGASRTVWIFAKDKTAGNYQATVEAYNSTTKELFPLTTVDLFVNSRSSKTPSLKPISPPQDEIPSPPAPVTSGTQTGGGQTGGSQTSGVLPSGSYNPYQDIFRAQYKGIYSGSIASEYQSGVYVGSTTQYQGKTLVVARRCVFSSSLASNMPLFLPSGNKIKDLESYVNQSKCYRIWVDPNEVSRGSDGGLDNCSSDSDCVQMAWDLINQVKAQYAAQDTNYLKPGDCVLSETHCIGKEIWSCVNSKWQIRPCPTYCTARDTCAGVNDTQSGSGGGGGSHIFYYNYLPPAYFNLPFAFMPIEFLLGSFSHIFSR